MTRNQRRHTQSNARAAQDTAVVREFREAVRHLQEGRLQQSLEAHQRVLAEAPNHAPSLHNLGLIAYKTNAREEAIDFIRRSLAADPKSSKAWLSLSIMLSEARRLDEAIDACRQCVALEPASAKSHATLGDLLRIARNTTDALGAYEQSLKCEPAQPAVLAKMGDLLLQSGRLDDALALSKRARSAAPGNPEAERLERNVLAAAGHLSDACTAIETQVGDPREKARRYDELAAFLRSRKRFAEAVSIQRRALTYAPDVAEYHFNLAAALDGAGQRDEALRCYQSGLAIAPDHADAYRRVGSLMRKMEKLTAAVQAFEHAAKLDPSLADAHYNLATIYKLQGRFAESRASFLRAIETAPDQLAPRFEVANLARFVCDWHDVDLLERQALDQFRSSERGGVAPFLLISMPEANNSDQLEAARRFAKTWTVPEDLRFNSWNTGDTTARRIRIGYLSSDFHSHATAMLLAEVLECTDRNRFELFAYCYSPDDGSSMRTRITKAFDRFVDIKDMTERAAAQAIHDDGIDILVDLKGYTRHARTEILAYRPAPIQVNYLGYPGTMGADYVDYIVADEIVAPMSHQDAYSERIVHLPNCYQPNDRKRRISDTPVTRAEFGLPETAFVFCSFNNTYKITSEVYDVWMRLLASVPGSVLWILANEGDCRRNLEHEAQVRGIDPSRIVFAERMEIDLHLARHRLADLFLDTLPCNAHTTASDALWAGLPVLTCLGETFSGRVAASLLAAMELPELIAPDLAAYERIALALARDRSQLEPIRRRIEEQRDKSSLFDTARYARNLERAFETMVDILRRGEPAQPFKVVEDVPKLHAPNGDIALEGAARVAYARCPICDGGDIPYQIEANVADHPLYNPQLPPTVKWRGCSDCGHAFAEGHLTREARDIVLSTTPEELQVGYDIEGQRKIAARLISRVARYVRSGEWLDVGSGNGSRVFTAAEWGFDPTGTDLRIDNVEMLLRLGFKAYWGNPEDLESVDRFSVVSMVGALERADHPKQILAAVHRMMRANGVLALSLPNSDTLTWRLLDANGANPYWGELEAQHIFTRKRLEALLEQQGFKVVEYAVSEDATSAMEIIAMKRA